MRHAFATFKANNLAGVAAVVLAISAIPTSAQAACNFDAPIGSCKLSANLTSQGLQISTDGASCATVDYEVNGSVRRMFIDQHTAMDTSVTSASSGVKVLACKSYSNSLSSISSLGQVPTLGQVSTTRTNNFVASERVLSSNLVATGSKTLQVNVPVYEKRVYVERQVPVERVVYVDKPVYIEKPVPVERKVYVDRPVYLERQVPVEKQVIVKQNVPVDRPVYVPYYLKPEVAVSYNQLVPGLPTGYNGQFQQQNGVYPAYPTPLPQISQ